MRGIGGTSLSERNLRYPGECQVSRPDLMHAPPSVKLLHPILLIHAFLQLTDKLEGVETGWSGAVMQLRDHRIGEQKCHWVVTIVLEKRRVG
ncbi:hypothetical protein LOAG_02264 [Loa loa]|uniref:Uncharacterized protein n=1 Tax=Loa loa TaxID=7209 RepID=A0A1S0U7V8_LOALO|nr:hypothetical protein LOAG_02264 [Loa loa]EFO26224.1 hypothetical protein LOAG_02264 [Loa loa]